MNRTFLPESSCEQISGSRSQSMSGRHLVVSIVVKSRYTQRFQNPRNPRKIYLC
ncbi:hypothetical protein Hanom_Chr02g00167821 [Helianthus anomalus]